MIVNSSGFALDAPGSYHISSAYSSEVRRIPISPHRMVADDDQSSGAFGSTVDDGDTADPFTSNLAVAAYIMGTKMSNAGAEGYIYCPMVPSGWKCTKLYVSVIDKSNGSAKAVSIAIVSRSYVNQDGSVMTNYLTRHLAKTGSSTNQEIALSPNFVPNGSNYLVVYINLGSTNDVFTGGYMRIVRQ